MGRGSREGMPHVEPMDRIDPFAEGAGPFVAAGPHARAVEAIRAALAAGDGPMLERAAHPMKGSAANLSAPRVVAVAGRLEEIGREGRFGEAQAACMELEDEVVHLGRALDVLKGEGAACGS